MNGFELNVPIRLYWDLFPVPADRPPDCRAVCRDILELKILSLNLTDFGTELSSQCLEILDCLHSKGVAISLAIAPDSFNPGLLECIRATGVRTLLVRGATLRELEVHRHIFAAASHPPVGIRFEVTADNWRELPELLAFCLHNRVPSLSLPMQRLVNGERCFFLGPEEKHQLSPLLQQIRIPSGLKITIHDPFLWKLFFPTVPFPDGGCQAANTMLYISPEGGVYPCPSLPVMLGDVGSISLKEIVNSAAKKQVRHQILRHPAVCAGCCEVASCKGGCRGRACAASGTLDSADPGCRA